MGTACENVYVARPHPTAVDAHRYVARRAGADAADPPTFAYVECDGMVFLVERDGTLVFPRPDEVPFPVETKDEMLYEDATVLFCVPVLENWPRDWVFKDALPAMANVHPLVQRAVNASLVREVVGAIILDGEGRMLMVKASRGFTKGVWNIPGGFVTYGETPEEGVVREVAEETGVEVRVVRLIGVYTARFKSPYYMRGFMYLAEPVTTELRLAPDEISEAAWMPMDEAHDATLNPFCRYAIEEYRKRG